MVHRRLLPVLLLAACSQPTEFARDNPKDPTGTAFELPPLSGLTPALVGRTLRLTWSTTFDRYTIHIERSVNNGPFVLRDTIPSSTSAWTDLSVAIPDSAVYRYRVFGIYQNRSTDTLTSRRITSALQMRSINRVHLDGTSTIRFSPWSSNPLGSVINGDLQTFHVGVDSIIARRRHPDGSVSRYRLMTQESFPNPKDTLLYRFIISQYSRGREVQTWMSPTIDSGFEFDIFLHDNLPGRFPAGFPRIQTSSGYPGFIFNYTDQNLSVAYVVEEQLYHYISRSSADLIASTVSVTSGRFLYSTPAGKVRSVILSQGTDTPMNVPEPASTLGAYYENGEIVYVRTNPGQPPSATLDRYNVFTQSRLLSVPIESVRPHRVMDRPDLNQIWVFDRGLMRIDRTTGATLQNFESAEPIHALMIGENRAFATFANNAPFVASYDLQTGAQTLHPIGFDYEDALFLTDGIHVLYRTSTAIRAHHLLRNKSVAETRTAYSAPSPVGFMPMPSATPGRFYFGYVDGYVIRLLEFTTAGFSYFARTDD